MECELCGKKTDHLKKVKIDGAVMAVCSNCEKFGTPLENYRNKPVVKSVSSYSLTNTSTQPVFIPQQKPRKKPGRETDIDELEIVPDYAVLIRETREKTGLTQDEFAAKIKEKRTSIAAIERGSLKPDIKTARKIELFLKIKLVEKF
ncbi:MAG: multiprotein bridging factor aMBF1 [Candidatus Thermoplasmatota archaeon]|jgi:putative transcription factor|nr:multiprotein bridging factor aMBF1 [Candidatus Thermoplasmatota archaeon]